MMQPLNPDQRPQEWHSAYRGYEGSVNAQEQRFAGKKLVGEKDEEWAEQHVRQLTHEAQAERMLRHPRLLVTLSSLGSLVCLFALLILAHLLTANYSAVNGLDLAFLVACVAVIVVNVSFNRTSLASSASRATGLTAVESVPSLPVAGESVTITYRGRLAVSAESITMHWGYSNFQDGFRQHWGQTYWNGVTDTALIKQRDGTWRARITIPADATALNMAFRNQRFTWDNNNTSNYYLAVVKSSDL